MLLFVGEREEPGLCSNKMASTGSSDAEEDNQERSFSPKKVGRAAEYPEFAIIWSYLENFCEFLRFPELSLDGLEDGFNSHSPRNENYRQLEYLHKKLLVKLHKNFRPEKWEKALLKVAKEQNMLSSWDLENFGYGELKVCTKLELFKMLLESQFDCNNKLKTEVNKNYEADELRLRPFGRDMDGLLYWFHMDESGGIRLYSTEEDEVENESWKLIASDLDELEVVVDYLVIKSATNPKDVVMVKREEEKKKEANSKPKKGKKSKKTAVVQEELDDDNPCARCYSNVHPDSILLCDKCDAAYHTACLRPPLLNVPQGDWFCPFCQQLVLLERLKEKKTRLIARQKLRARQAKRLNKSGMNLSNILQGPNSDEEQIETIRRSGRARKTVDYTFRDFDEEIKDAVEIDLKAAEMNGHPTGKPAFAVDRFYTGGSSSKPAPRVGKRRSRRLKDLDSASDTDSKYSDCDYDASSDDDRPKPPKRHVYLRRHIIEDDDEEVEENRELKTNGENEEKETSEQEEIEGEGSQDMVEDKSSKDNIRDSTEEPAEEKEQEHQEKTEIEESADDSQVSGKVGEDDTSSEQSGPTSKPFSLTNAKDNKTNGKDQSEQEEAVPKEKKEKKEDTNKAKTHPDQHKKSFLEVPGLQSKPPPLERINSPKIDPLLDSLGFGALASCFSSGERRPDPYGTILSPTASRNPRSPLRPDPGFATDRMGVPSSPSSYPRVGADGRYNFPDYGQASSYGSYYGFNQSAPSVGTYPGSPPGRPPSYSISMAGSRQFPGYNQSGFSNRETSAFSQTPQSPSYSQSSTPAMSPFGNPLSTGYPTAYSDAGSRAGYYPSSTQGYDLPTKSPYGHPSQGYYPDDPFSTGIYLSNPTANPLPPGGINSWPTPPTGSGSYFPQSGMGQNRTGI